MSGPGSVRALFDKIESLYGDLRGMEASWEVMIAPQREYEKMGEEGGGAVFNTLPTSRAFHFRGSHAFERDYPFPDSGDTNYNDEFAKKLQTAMDAAFKTAKDGADGVCDYWRYHLEPVSETDVAPVQNAAREMDKVATWLGDFHEEEVPTFVTNLTAAWPATADGPQSFYLFYEDLADICTHYWGGATRLACVTAGVARVVELYQKNLDEVLQDGRDRLITSLESWQANKGPEALKPRPSVSQILGGASLALGIVGLFPPAAAVAGGASVVSGILSYAADGGEETQIAGATASVEIITKLFTGVASLRREFDTALDDLSQRRPGLDDLGTYVSEVLGNPNWKPNEVDLSM